MAKSELLDKRLRVGGADNVNTSTNIANVGVDIYTPDEQKVQGYIKGVTPIYFGPYSGSNDSLIIEIGESGSSGQTTLYSGNESTDPTITISNGTDNSELAVKSTEASLLVENASSGAASLYVDNTKRGILSFEDNGEVCLNSFSIRQDSSGDLYFEEA